MDAFQCDTQKKNKQHTHFMFMFTEFVDVVFVETVADAVDPTLNAFAASVFGLAGSSDTRTCGLF